MTGRFFDQDRIKNDQNSDKNKGCFLSSKSLRPFYRATHLVSPSRIGQTGEYSKFKFTKPRSATRWATLYIKKCVLSPAGGSHLLNFVPYLYLTSICRFFLIKYDIDSEGAQSPHERNQDFIWSLSGRDDFDESSPPFTNVDLDITERVTKNIAKVQKQTNPDIVTLQSEANFFLNILWVLGSAVANIY